jgi:hypothetical protein
MSSRTLTAFLVLAVLPASTFAQPLADRVPKDVLVYAGWAGSSGMGKSYDESHLKALLESSGMPKFIEDSIPQALRRIGELDRHAAEPARLVADLGRVMWKYPTAFFASGLGVRDGVPTPRVGILCRAGADATMLETRLSDLLLQISKEIPLEIRVFRLDDLVGVVVGYEEGEFKPGNNVSLDTLPEFQNSMKTLQPDPVLAVYVDADAIRRMGERLIAQFGEADVRREWPRVRDAIGIAGLKQIAFTAGFRNKNWETNLLIGAPSPRSGLLKLLDAEPINDEVLKLIPRSARLVGAMSIDGSRVLSDFRSFAGQLDPHVRRDIDRSLEEIVKEFGIDVQRDLLDQLGKQWAYYTAPRVGGNGLLGVVFVNRPRDVGKLSASLEKLSDSVNQVFAKVQRHDEPIIRIRETQAGEVRIKYLATPVVSPAWTVRGGNLYVALYPQVVAAAANLPNKAGESILDNPQFAAMRKEMAGDSSAKMSSVTFMDLPQMVPDAYPTLLAMSRLSGFADLLGVTSPAMMLPPMETFTAHVTPAASAIWTDDAGWHWRSSGPFPAASVVMLKGLLP